jgi:hypothetical protein
MHNQIASIVALARTMLMDVEGCQAESVSVRKASLDLILKTFIELGGHHPSPIPHALSVPAAHHAGEAQRRHVADHLAAVDLEMNPPGGREGGWTRG